MYVSNTILNVTKHTTLWYVCGKENGTCRFVVITYGRTADSLGAG
jgi:hypothetical protein